MIQFDWKDAIDVLPNEFAVNFEPVTEQIFEMQKAAVTKYYENARRAGLENPPAPYCYIRYDEDTMSHVFVCSAVRPNDGEEIMQAIRRNA